MIKKGISVKKYKKKKQVLYGILIGRPSAESLSRDLLIVAELRHHLASVHVCSASDSALIENSATKDHSNFCRDFSIVKKLTLKRSISQGSLIKKVLKSGTKHFAATTVMAETNRESTLGSAISFARCCANKLPATTAILVIYKERIIPTKQSVLHLKGFKLNSRPEFYHNEESSSLGYAEEEVSENMEPHGILTSEDVSRYGSDDSNDHNFNVDHYYKEKAPLTSNSLIRKELRNLILGWPLLRRNFPLRHEVLSRSREKDMSVVEWVMSLPSRSTTVDDEKNMSNLDWNKGNTALDREMDNSIPEDHDIEGKILLRIQSVEDQSVDGSTKLKDESLSLVPGDVEEVASSSVSLLAEELSQSKPGWPLLRISAPLTLDSSRESEDMNFSNRSTAESQPSLVSTNMKNSFWRVNSHSNDRDDENCLNSSTRPANESEVSSKLIYCNCKQFSYAELKVATCQFSSDNLIGEGGCSKVYKGCLPSGQPVAVKLLKSYKEASNDFYLEVDIISSLRHQNITPLIGVCTQDNNLILVYDFLPKGSLEESLHGNGKKSVLPWEVRFKVAVGIAEALNYLHKECLRPVIHRDVKSSNILLSDDFQPQLSDFGLAIWGPIDATYMIQHDVVGTFGYIAPEYFMHGRISDKVDIYSFGVVLLELLSGRRPIRSKDPQGQESLVKWAKPILESGDVKALLDRSLGDDIDIDQMQRMVLVANLCINQSAQLRPTVSQILELLRGKEDANIAEEWIDADVKQEDDDLLLEFGGRPLLDFSFLVTDDATSLISANAVSLSSIDQKRRAKLKDYLKEPQD